MSSCILWFFLFLAQLEEQQICCSSVNFSYLCALTLWLLFCLFESYVGIISKIIFIIVSLFFLRFFGNIVVPPEKNEKKSRRVLHWFCVIYPAYFWRSNTHCYFNIGRTSMTDSSLQVMSLAAIPAVKINYVI